MVTRTESKHGAADLGTPGSLEDERPVDEGTWLENRPSRGWLPRFDVKEWWAYRDLALVLAMRDVRLRYKQAVFGIGWAILQPLVGTGIFTLVFGHFTDVPSDGLPYAVFAYAGLAIWLFVSNGVQHAAESLVESRELITKTYFPRILAPAAAVLPGLLDLAVALVVLACLMVGYGTGPGRLLVLAPLFIAAALVVALGAGLLLAALNALYRDVRYALGFLTQVWLFASPVVFPSSIIDGAVRWAYALNPMVGVIDGFRWSVLDAPAPPAADLVSAVSALVLLVGGLAYFQRVERRLADRI
jgi:lipopolysaccharide transport system permease protein